MSESGRGVHDMGGLAAGPVVADEHDFAPWEKRVDALLVVLGGLDPPLVRTDELRRGIEQLGEGAYDRLGYYERWIASITGILLEKGVFTTDELGAAMEAAIARREETIAAREEAS